MYLEIKTQALTQLRALSDLRAQWSGRHNIPEGLERLIKGVYCKSLLWYGGQSGGWDDPAAWLTRGFMLGLKGVKTWLLVNLLTALVHSLVEFAHCPNEFKDLEQGEIGPISNTLECFNEYVRIFNQIPGQPVETLTDLIPNVAFPGNQYALDLSNKGLNATALVQILDAFEQSGIELVSIDLSGNLANTSPQDYKNVGEAIGQHENLRTLIFEGNNLNLPTEISFFLEGLNYKNTGITLFDFSGNGIGLESVGGTVALGEGLRHFPNLLYLDLSDNTIGLADDGIIAIAEGLQSLPRLVHLDLSQNNIGLLSSNGTIAIGGALNYLPNLTYLDLSANEFEAIDTNATVAIGKGLQHLSNLTYLDLRSNFIGSTGDEGIRAIGEGFTGTPNLELFRFFPQQGTISPPMVALLNQDLTKTKANSLPSLLMTQEDIQNYLRNLPPSTTEINLSGQLNNPTATLINTLFQGLREHFLKVTFLDLSGNSIGWAGTNETVALGNGLQFLSDLTHLNLSNNGVGTDVSGIIAIREAFPYISRLTYLDLSYSDVGLAGDEGTVILGEGLQALSNLTYLDLSYNDIGETGDAGTIALGKGLQYLPKLTYMNLGNNWIGLRDTNGAVAIGKGLQHLPNLTYLALNNNFIGWTGTNGTVVIGEGLQYLSRLTYLDLSVSQISDLGEEGAIAIGLGLKNNTVLKILNLSDNALGQYGSQGVELILQNVVREGLNLNLAGAVGIPWSTGAQALATLNAGPVAAACYQQRCFGNTPPQNTTAIQSVGTRRVLAIEEVLAREEDDMALEESQPGFLSRWGQNARSFVSHAATSTKQTVQSYWDVFGTWLTNTLTDAAHEVVTNSPSYFPNGNNPDVRDWPVGGVFFNTTSTTNPAPALPAVPVYALP